MDQQPSNDPTAAASSEKFVTTPLVIIFITIFIDLIGFGMVIPLLPYYAVFGLFLDAVLFLTDPRPTL